MSTAEMLKFSLLLTPKKVANNVTIVIPSTGLFLNLCILFQDKPDSPPSLPGEEDTQDRSQAGN